MEAVEEKAWKMTTTRPITALFIDLGNVLLTDSWGPAMRQKAVEQFGFDFAEVAKRSQLPFEGYEEGNISLDEYPESTGEH